jgi:methylthioribose-1-phosphate isomerase
MAPLTSIRTSNGKLEIVNQLLLPHIVEFLEINTIAAAHDAIKTMKVFVFNFCHPLQASQPN